MWIFLICGNVSNVLITHKELKERGRYMKKFKIIKVKEYQILQPNGIVISTKWIQQRDITSDQTRILRLSPEGYVERMSLEFKLPIDDLMNGIQFEPRWIRDNNYRVIWSEELQDTNGDPWKMFVKRHMRRKKQNPVEMGQTI